MRPIDLRRALPLALSKTLVDIIFRPKKPIGMLGLGPLFLTGCLLSGCQITLTDNGTFGMRAGYDVSFYHVTARTDSTTVAKVESQPLTDWLKRGAPQQTDATPTGSEAVPRS